MGGMIIGNDIAKQDGNNMFYYNVLLNDGSPENIIPLSKEEYETSVSNMVTDFTVGEPETIPAIMYHESGFYLGTTEQLIIDEKVINYYKVSITKDALRISSVSKMKYGDVEFAIDDFNVFRDYVDLNGKRYDAIGYYVNDNMFDRTRVQDEGFYIALENEELPIIEWVRNFGAISS